MLLIWGLIRFESDIKGVRSHCCFFQTSFDEKGGRCGALNPHSYQNCLVISIALSVQGTAESKG